MKKILTILLALALLATTVVGFAGVTDPAANQPGELPVTNEDISLSIALSKNDNVLDYDTNAYTLLMEELTGVDIVFDLYPSADATTKMDLLVNSGSELPDILTFGLTDSRLLSWGSEGILVDHSDYFDRENGLAKFYWDRCDETGVDGDTLIKYMRSGDGGLYTMFGYFPVPTDVYPYRAWINVDWLETLGLEAPTTSEELVEVLTAFRDQDPNGNGIADEIPMLGRDSGWKGYVLTYLQNMFIYYDGDLYNNNYLPLSTTDGKIDVSYDKQEYRDFLIYANKLVSEKLVDPLSFTIDGTQFNSLIRDELGVVGIIVIGGAGSFHQYTESYEPLNAMIGPEGLQWVTTEVPMPGSRMAITADCEHPEVAFLFGDAANSSNLYFLSGRYGIEGTDFVYASEDQQSLFWEEGIQPTVNSINYVWGAPNNSIWCANQFPFIMAPTDMMEVYTGNEHNNERLHAKFVMRNRQYGPAYDDVVTKLIYTDAEIEEWSEPRTSLQTYVKESRTLFATGELDPNSDTDWQNYLNELEALRYQEIIALDQQVYDRMNAE